MTAHFLVLIEPSGVHDDVQIHWLSPEASGPAGGSVLFDTEKRARGFAAGQWPGCQFVTKSEFDRECAARKSAKWPVVAGRKRR